MLPQEIIRKKRDGGALSDRRHPGGSSMEASMELLVLGAGPAYSDLPGSAGASYLVRVGDDTLVLDLGHGAFQALARLACGNHLDRQLQVAVAQDRDIDLADFEAMRRRGRNGAAESSEAGRAGKKSTAITGCHDQRE